MVFLPKVFSIMSTRVRELGTSGYGVVAGRHGTVPNAKCMYYILYIEVLYYTYYAL
jgi:hypothetical protein